jgi:hypothetical protein
MGASGSGAAGSFAIAGAGFAGGRNSGDGNAVGGDEIEFADQLPLCDGVCGRSGGEGEGVCGRGGAGEGVCGRGGGEGGAAARIGEGGGEGGAAARIGDVVRGGGVGGAVRAGAGTEGTFVIGCGVGTRGAVSVFGRGAFAGTGTIGFGLPGSVDARCSVCDPRGDAGGVGG